MTDAAVPRSAETAHRQDQGAGWLRRMLDSDIFHSFRRSRMTMVAAVITVLFFLLAIFAPVLSVQNPFDPAQNIGGGRIDLMVSFDGFRFVIELKREQDDATRSGLAGYLRQAGAYQVTDVAVGMLVVLDTTADALAPHMRDNVWVDVLAAAEPGGTDRYLVVVRVPGNRKSPSRL